MATCTACTEPTAVDGRCLAHYFGEELTYIDGQATLRVSDFSGRHYREVLLTNVVFEDEVDFAGTAVAGRMELTGVVFRGAARFGQARFEGVTVITGVTFAEEVSCTRATLARYLGVRQSWFRADARFTDGRFA